MIRIWTRIGDSPGMHDLERLTDPVAAEALYLSRVLERRREASALVVAPSPGTDLIVPPASYRLDRGWSGGPREQVPERYRQLWAPPPEWAGPTPFQLRGLVLASGLSGSAIARRIDVTPRQWRRWLSDPDSGQARIPYTAWVTALRVTGLLPEGEHR